MEKFEEKDFQILRVLLKLLEASRETRTLAVGCHDLGMFITNHPHGRSIVTGNVKSSCSMSHVQAFLYTELDDGHPMPHMPVVALSSGAAAAAYLLLRSSGGSCSYPVINRLAYANAEFRGKELVMRLMMHPEPEVQKQALLCVQKIMLAKDKLEYLNSN